MGLGGQRIAFYSSFPCKLCVENYTMALFAASLLVKWHRAVEMSCGNGVNLSPRFQNA